MKSICTKIFTVSALPALIFSLFIFVMILFCKKVLPLVIYLPESGIIDFIEHKNLRIMLSSPYRHLGERQAHRYMCSVLRKQGYNPICVYNQQIMSIISYLIDIDICINSDQKLFYPKNSYNCLIIHTANTEIKNKYDAILSVIPEEESKKLFCNELIVPFYFSVPTTKFCNNPKTRLFFGGDISDKYRSSIAILYNLLDSTGYFDLYGSQSFELNSYKGFIPFGENTVLDAMRKSGVTLVLHSASHFKNNIPTARIFEALAASTVIISDKLPFIVNNFGDSVLYIDRNLSPQEMFKQINAHMKWILSHPQEAIKLARRSHKIFIENFALEKFMKNVTEHYKSQTKSTSR